MAEFKNAALNKKFKINGDDKKIRLNSGFYGMLSDVQAVEDIEKMISRGSNLVAVKAETSNKPATTN